ncbi:hypothetical protein [Synechococcus sp. M16CYN]|uniref:hypothetical protein n=1 Tax=Synechococcus sp. M16CYN TaxID=3103139 RepID=UPI0032464A38
MTTHAQIYQILILFTHQKKVVGYHKKSLLNSKADKQLITAAMDVKKIAQQGQAKAVAIGEYARSAENCRCGREKSSFQPLI